MGRRWMAHLGLALLLLLLGCATSVQEPAAPAAAAPRGPLRILLVNDDGIDAPGLAALREALAAEGHQLVVAAPATNRSGSGVALKARGVLEVQELEPEVYAVDGTPADCVRVALSALLEHPVDLVVSGINRGQNVGPITVSSGTVGGALTAVMLGIPGIAVSQAYDPEAPTATARFFGDAAAFTVALIDSLSRQSGELLPPWTMLNVNHPARHAPDIAGVKFTRQGRTAQLALTYDRRFGDKIEVRVLARPEPDPVPDSDSTALAQGFITITPLDGDWTASDAVYEQLKRETGELSWPPGLKGPIVSTQPPEPSTSFSTGGMDSR